MPKKSTFTGITSVPGSYFFDVFGQGFNYRISKSNLFQQIESEIGTPGVQSLNDLSGALQFIAGTNMSVDINEAEGTFTFNGSLSPDSIQSISFDTSAGHVVGEGELAWNDLEKTLDLGVGGGSTVQIGQEIFIRVVNQSGSTLVDGEMVYITGSQGFRPTVDRAIATSITADMTIGMVTQEIPNNGQGFITNLGIVRDFDTSGFAEGDDLWVSDTVAGGITNVKPDAPNQSVHVGVVIRQHASLGSVFVRILKEEQLTDLHDVSITDLDNNDIISYDSGSETWVNAQPEDFGIITTDGGQTIVSPVFGLNGVAYSWPGADGANGQVLTTSGSGTLTWQSSSFSITDGVTTAPLTSSIVLGSNFNIVDEGLGVTTVRLYNDLHFSPYNTLNVGGQNYLRADWDGVNLKISAFGKATTVDRPVLDAGNLQELITALGSNSGIGWVDDSSVVYEIVIDPLPGSDDDNKDVFPPVNPQRHYTIKMDTTDAPKTAHMVASASWLPRDTIRFIDYAGTFTTNNFTIDFETHNFEGLSAQTLVMSVDHGAITLEYIDPTLGFQRISVV